MRSKLIILALCILSQPTLAYYKCTNSNNKVTYQKYPCSEESKETAVRVDGDEAVHKEYNDIYSLPNADRNPRTVRKLKPYVYDDNIELPDDNEKVEKTEPDNEGTSYQRALVLRSKIYSARASLQPIMMASAMYYVTEGEWPRSLSDIGMDESSMHSRDIDSVELAEQQIIAKLNASYGINKKIIVTPHWVMSGTNIEWHCHANFSSKVLPESSIGSGCQSKAFD
ncbi:pilin [Sinobacterium caligoides]|uniref:Pilin n=1 Tax=Sinobacterium caligoides TaxID=933926 RepID=A0A3N2DJM9_9GAMM|nr:pilin [Sinobacterium caligoides]ROS00001.1 pilin [Sinobacterium caligoides]